jgi:hypothetical protein
MTAAILMVLTVTVNMVCHDQSNKLRQSERRDEALLCKRSAARGDLVVEVKPGDVMMGMANAGGMRKPKWG